MTATADVLTAAHYRRGSLSGKHCSGCIAYTRTTMPGVGRCATNEGASVHFEAVCDKWKARG